MRRKKRLSAAVILFTIYSILTLCLPVFAEPADEKIVIVLDAGHGGYDGGTDTGIRTEKEYNLIVATYLYEELSADDRFEVIMTRTDDTYLKFLPRAMVALENNADLLLSLHFNSNSAAYVKGNMAYCSVVERFNASVLAGKLLDAISAAVPIDRGTVEYVKDTGDSLGVYYWDHEKQWDMPGAWHLGMKSDYYSINTWSSKFGIPSIIMEHGYLSNRDEAAVIDKDENLRAMAKAQAKAIVDFYTGHTHTFGDMTTDYPSNCTLAGTASYRCTVCGMKSGTVPLSANPDGHYWRQLSSAAATCTTDGYAEFVCQIAYNLNDKGYTCDVHKYTETYPATGHNYIVTEDVQAAHGVDGVHTEVCQNCGDTISTRTPGEPHTYTVTESVAPGCEEAGKTVYTCSVCGSFYEETISAPGHVYEEVNYVPATPEKDGYRDLRCAACGDEKTETEFACEHQFGTEEIPPTCENDGKIVETCQICGYVKEEEIPAAGHDYIKQMDVASTCSAAGFYKGKCRVCGDVVTENRPVLPHSFETVSETSHERLLRCSVCGYEHTEEIARDSIADIVRKPVVLVIIGIAVVQIAVIGVLAAQHRKKKLEEMRRRIRFETSYDETPDNIPAETDSRKPAHRK